MDTLYNYVGVPYIEGLTDEMFRILRKFNIGVYTHPYRTIENILPKLKDCADAIYKRGAIYKIHCKDCRVYILMKRAGASTLAYLNINVI